MKCATISPLLPTALLLAAGVVALPACGPGPSATVSTAEPAADDASSAAAAGQALVERESELDAREAEVRAAASDLDLRVRELEQRLDRVEQRESRLDERERELARRAEATPEKAPAVAREPKAAPAATPVAALPPEPQPEAQWITLMLPTSTRVDIELQEPLSSETNVPGDPVRAVVTRDLMWTGHVAIPAGSRVSGSVIDAVPAKSIGGQAALSVAFDGIETPAGERLAIRAHLEVEGKNQKKKDAATIGGSAAGGAVLGRVLSKDKTKGTVLGAVLGAAIGTAVASRNAGDPVVLEAGTPAQVLLDAPVDVAVRVEPSGATLASRN